MIVINTYGLKETQQYFNKVARGMPKAMKKGELRVAKSVQQKARFIVESETITHTGLLRSDIRIKPTGRHYKVVAGEHAPQAYWIEHGRAAIMGYKFVPTQLFPLEGYAVRSPRRSIRAYKGIKFMQRAREHGRRKAKRMIEREIKKVIK